MYSAVILKVKMSKLNVPAKKKGWMIDVVVVPSAAMQKLWVFFSGDVSVPGCSEGMSSQSSCLMSSLSP